MAQKYTDIADKSTNGSRMDCCGGPFFTLEPETRAHPCIYFTER